MIQSFKLPARMDSQSLPTKQLEILKLLYKFRFLTTHQITQLLPQTSLRLTNYHLKQLSETNFIGKHYSRSLGYGNNPAVYYLASGSIPLVGSFEGVTLRILKRIYREKIRSQQFIDHARFIADYYLFLLKESKASGYSIRFFSQTDLLSHPYVIHPLPDAYFARTDGNKLVKRYFVEVIEDSSPRFAIRNRVNQYNDYLEEEKFELATRHSFPTILFICPGIASLIYLKKHIGRIYDETSFDHTKIFLATREQAFKGIWEEVLSDPEAN